LCNALAVEIGAGLSCLRRERKKETNPWNNLDLPDVFACREKYMENGKSEKNFRPIAISSSTSHRKAISKDIRKKEFPIVSLRRCISVLSEISSSWFTQSLQSKNSFHFSLF